MQPHARVTMLLRFALRATTHEASVNHGDRVAARRSASGRRPNTVSLVRLCTAEDGLATRAKDSLEERPTVLLPRWLALSLIIIDSRAILRSEALVHRMRGTTS